MVNKLKNNGITIYQCPADADTTIVRVAREQNQTVNAYSDDTDIFTISMWLLVSKIKAEIVSTLETLLRALMN